MSSTIEWTNVGQARMVFSFYLREKWMISIGCRKKTD